MKLTAFFLLVGMFSLHATSSFSQIGKVTINLENATLSSVFDEIETQTNYDLFYKKDALNDQRRVSLDVDNAEVAQVLRNVLSGEDVVYKVVDKSIIIVPRSLAGDDTSMQQPSKTISGQVLDSQGSPIPGVSVVIKGTSEPL